jgi:hypothetical protein
MTTLLKTIEAADRTNVIVTEVIAGLWSPDDTGSLAAVHTSSYQKAISGEFYYDLYNLDPSVTSNNAESQFAVAYGHVSGGGSPIVDETVLGGNSLLPTQAVYSQYRNVLLTSGSKFTFGSTESDDIYVININRARTKQSLDAGNWQLALSGSKGIRTFVDKSGYTGTTYGNVLGAAVYDVVSGSLSGLSGTTFASDTTVYGLAFPDYGVIVLNPAGISASVGFSGSFGASNLNAITNMPLYVPFAPYTGSAAQSYQYNHDALYRSIRLAMAGNSPFVARSAEQVSSVNFAINVKYADFNYTNNPTAYTTDSDGTRKILPAFADKPVTYITTVGLYNATNELVAVAKLSRPLQKSIDKAALIRVRLDF